MCRDIKDIMENDPIIGEIQDHIDKNNLTDLERLQLRVQKHNYAKVLQIQDDVSKHIGNEKCHTPGGLLIRGPVIAWGTTILLLSFTLFYIVATVVGVDELLKAAMP
jgi:Mg2+/Co2+ transporter CorC